MLSFGREVCGQPEIAHSKEWLVTNGLGGYALGTVGGALTRRYHGLLVAALRPPVSRALLVSKLDETAHYLGRAYPLFTNHWAEGPLEPEGFLHLERFSLQHGLPVWIYACADARLVKRVWMRAGANTTYVAYTLAQAQAPLTLSLKALVNDRDHHANTTPHPITVHSVPGGLQVRLPDIGATVHLISDRATAAPAGQWHSGYHLPVEAGRGLEATDAHFHAGDFVVTLAPGETATFVLTAEPVGEDPDPRRYLHGEAALAEQHSRAAMLMALAALPPEAPPAIHQLVLAADQFIVKRQLPDGGWGATVIAGYPWFTDWGRDTMIALPGLTLATRRFEVAAGILRTFARYLSRGMLPNYYPDGAAAPEYNTVDATLWYFEAVRAYHAATGDLALVRELFPALAEIIAWHTRGTRYGIRVDPADGLLAAGEPGVQLTWMDVKIDNWVVTPRTGKAVEINALWHNALCTLADFARALGEPAEAYDREAARTRAGFARFWNAERGYCFDVLDGPEGADPTLRPNQLLAVSLAHSPLPPDRQRAVVLACARELLTSHGMRTLAPADPHYHGRYNGDRVTRDTAYHQGTVWAWLIGPFVSAHYRVHQDRAAARACLEPLLLHLADHGLGAISEVFDADPPHAPHACMAQAWSVAEVLRAWRETQEAG